MAETVKDKGWRFSLDTGMSTDGAGSSPAGLILSAGPEPHLNMRTQLIKMEASHRVNRDWPLL